MQAIQDGRIVEPIREGTQELDRVSGLSEQILEWVSGSLIILFRQLEID